MKRLLAGVVLMYALTAAAPARAEWPLAGASTTIEGTTTGFAEIHVPRPVPITGSDDEWLPKVRLSGHGRLYGVVLRLDDPAARDPLTLGASSGDGDGDPPEVGLWPMSGAFPEGDHPALPAGDYRIYLLADGQPVRADVLLPGLDGQTSVSPQVPVPERIASLPRVDAGGPAAIFAGEGTLSSTGLAMVRPHATSAVDLVRRTEACAYPPGEGSGVAAVDFGPGCDDPIWLVEGLAFGDFEVNAPPGPSERGFEAWSPEAAAGTWSLGGNIEDAGAQGTLEMFGIWLAYEPAPGTLLPTRPADSAPPAPAPATDDSAAVAPAAPAAKPPAKAKTTKKKHKRRHRKHHRRHKHRRHKHRA